MCFSMSVANGVFARGKGDSEGRSTNATASRHVVPTFPTGVFYVFVFINIMFLSYAITEGGRGIKIKN